MAKGKRLSVEDKAKVITAKLKNPDASTRDIEKETWVNNRSAARILNEDLTQVVASKDERIAKIVANDTETVENMSELAKLFSGNLLKRAQEHGVGTIFNSEVKLANEITSDSFKRKQLLDGWPTENVKFIESIDIV